MVGINIDTLCKVLTGIAGRAAGTPSPSIPWEMIKAQPERFLDLDKCWVNGIEFKDPSKLKLHEVIQLLKLWQREPAQTFRWKAYVVNRDRTVVKVSSRSLSIAVKDLRLSKIAVLPSSAASAN